MVRVRRSRRRLTVLVGCLATTFALLAGMGSAAQAAPTPGSYTGSIPGNSFGLTFFVSSDSSHLQEVHILGTSLICTGEGSSSAGDHLEVPEETIAANGSFSGTPTTAKGVLEGSNVTFTYTFSGQFNTATTASGTYREDIAFEGSTRRCTTNNQSFSATRDTQPTQTTTPPPPGSYTGSIPGNSFGLTFFVDATGTHLQEVHILGTNLQCFGSASTSDHLEVPEETIAGDGSFSGTPITSKGVLEGSNVTFTYTFSGHFHATGENGAFRASGTYREDIAFEGSTRRCTTNNQSFSATRDTQPTQTTTPPPPGSYTGSIPGNSFGLTFFVDATGTHLQEVHILGTNLQCFGSASTSDHLEVPEETIAGDGSFSGTPITSKGVLEGSNVTFTYTFSGHFHATGENGAFRASGTYREDIAFEGSTRRCTTNNQSFSATRDTQPTQTTTPPPPGSYTGSIPGNSFGLTFFVDAKGKHLQEVHILGTILQCVGSGSGGTGDHLEIAEITIKSTGSFASTTKATQKGLLAGAPVTLTYTFSGHFHATGENGAFRASGTYREDIAFEGSTRRCTTNNQSFSATRDTQPTQTTKSPPPGSYTGSIPGNSFGLTFAVSSKGTAMQSVQIATVSLECTGPGSGGNSDHLEIPEIAIKAKSKFATIVTVKGLIGSAPVTFTYTFSGHFHATGQNGAFRASGTYRDEIAFEGSTRRCTSNGQSWSATHN
jgi:hypothetical protein